MDKWDIIHRYRNRVEEGRLPELTCRICGARLVSRLGPNDDPMFLCLNSHTMFPGDSWYQTLEKMIRGI